MAGSSDGGRTGRAAESRGGAETRREELSGEEGGAGTEAGVSGATGAAKGTAWRGEGGSSGAGASGLAGSNGGKEEERAAWKRRMASGERGVWERRDSHSSGRDRGLRPEVSGRRLAKSREDGIAEEVEIGFIGETVGVGWIEGRAADVVAGGME